MPVDGGGIITRHGSPIPVTGQTADAPQVNVPVDDIYAALNMLMFLDGRKPLRGNIPMNGYRATGAANAVGQQDYVTLAQVQQLLQAFGSVPTGSMFPLTGNTVPSGYVQANGQSLSRATFPTLWAWVQSSGNLVSQGSKTRGNYGTGDGSTNFTVPDLISDSGYFIRSVSPGRTAGDVQGESFASHFHAAGIHDPGHAHNIGGNYGALINAVFRGSFFSGVGGSATTLYYDTPALTANSNGTGVRVTSPNGLDTTYSAGGSETRPRNIAYPWIIKA